MRSAVIFDMDGVIVDSEPAHIKAEMETLSPFGIELKEEELRDYMGRSSRVLFRDIIKKYELNTTFEKIYSVHKRNLLRLYQDEVGLIEGVVVFIERLLRSGFILALASSSDREIIDSVLNKFNLRRFFSTAVSGEEIERTKPDPEIFLVASERLRVDPASCVVIEDSYAGVKAAKSAGMFCVGFRSKHSLNQNLSIADILINSFDELSVEELAAITNGYQNKKGL